MKNTLSASIRLVVAHLGLPLLLCLALFPGRLMAQGEDLTVVVLVDSSNTTDYNTNPASPGTYQMGPERYLVHLQVPYRVIDVSKTPAPDLSTVQLIIAGHAGITLGADWQAAITSAVYNGTGFVNLDNSPTIALQTHIQNIFGATGATIGGDQTSIVIPAAVQVGGSTPHYIDALQRHWAGDPAGDITYNYHGNGTIVIPSNATILTGATGTVVARLGTDPLIVATTYGKGRAVDFTTYAYLHADRFGFVEGVDDLFWRSLVWAARKPFVLRGYPRIAAIQMDDNEPGIMSRIPDMWNTTFTGPLAADSTGGPWNLQINLQLSSLGDPGGERAQMISAIQANQMHASPHGLNYGSGGDLYWNLTVPNTDAQWKANVTSALQWQAGQGGSDTFPPFSPSMVAHYWDISNNSGYEMWHSLGLRYITSPQAPGVYYFTVPKTPAQRIPLGPYRIYEQPPIYTGDEEETFPFFFADDLSVGSVAGEPAQTFFAFGSQVGLEAGRFTRPDALFPSSQNSYTVAQSLNQWEFYMWNFWSGMAPVQIYTHDGSNLEYTTASDRQTFITQLSQWFSANHGQHFFMDTMGAYLRARNHSLLASGSVTSSAITLNFTGSATTADGATVDTKTYIFYGDDEGTLLDIPGFTNGATYSFPNTQPASMLVDPLSLAFAALPGTSPASQSISVANVGSGSFNWTVSSNASWLATTAASGTSNANVTVQVNSASLTAGKYTGALTFTAAGALNSPQTIPVSLNVSTPALVPSPASLTFTGTVGGAAPPPDTVSITNPSGSNLAWTATSNAPWLSAATGVAGTPGSVIISVAPGSMPLGVYNGSITLQATSGGVPSVTIPVAFDLSGTIDSPSMASLNAWTVSPLGNAAGWTSSGGAIHYNGGGESQIYTGSPAWTDYDADFNLTLSSLSDYPGGIRIRVNPANGSGYALWMYPAEHALTLFNVVNWNIGNGYTALASTSNITFDTKAHTLRLSAHGNQISASYDGTPVISVIDNSYTTGLIALDPSNQPVTYNSVVVSSSSNQTTAFSTSPTTLSFSAIPGYASLAAQTISLASNPTAVSWTASSSVPWLTATPAQGTTTPGSASISATAVNLTVGTYTGVLTFTPSAGSPVNVTVTLTVATPSPLLVVTPSTSSLLAYVGQSPPALNLSIANQSGAAFSWTAASDQSWLALSPASGSTAATLVATPSVASLSPGSYTANITITAPGLPNSPIVVPVSLTLSNATLLDDFTNNALGWVISPSGLATNFSVANQTYSYNGGGNTQSCSGSPTYTNYEFDFGMRLGVASDYPGGVRARVNPATGAGYGLWFYPSEGIIKLLNITAWSADSSSLIAQASAKLDTLTHYYRFVLNGSIISVYQDNVLLLTATDPTYTSGEVCFDPSNQPVAYSQALVLSSLIGATLTPSSTSLSFASPNSGANPLPQNLNLSSDFPVTYGVASSVPWLTATLSSATTPATVNVAINNASLANGNYSGSLTIGSPGSSNSPLVIPVTLALSSASLGVAPASLDLFSIVGASPAPVAIAVQNLGTGIMPWAATSDSNWLVPTPASAAGPGPLTLTPTTGGLPIGNALAHVTVTASGGSTASIIVPVTAHLGTSIFTDTFASGSAQWTPSPLGFASNWSVANNSFLYNGNGHTQQYAGSQSWANYVVSTGITLSNLYDYPGGLRGRVNLSTGAAYVAWLYPAEHVIKLFRTTGWDIDSSGLTLLGQSSTILMDTNPHNLRLGFSGSQITVYYDNSLVITATDTTLPAGAIALDVSSQPVSFSNVIVLQQ